jgi:hypothetical protein
MADTTTTAQEALLQNVLATFQNTPNARLKEIVEATIRHMHALIDEVQLTQEEWMAGIQFLTAVGKFTTDQRHEMILLSDVTGVSSLVEMLNYKGLSGATENTVLGRSTSRDRNSVLMAIRSSRTKIRATVYASRDACYRKTVRQLQGPRSTSGRRRAAASTRCRTPRRTR